MRRRAAPLAFALLAAAALAIFALAFARALPFTVDDAFITFRYAENLARHGRPVFNLAGPPAEGYTSPLWLLACAAATRAGADVVIFAKAAGALAALATIALAARTAWQVTGDAAAAGAALLSTAAFSPTAIHAAAGMETALYALALSWVAASAAAYVRSPDARGARRLAVAALTAGLTRPDGNLFAAVAIAATLALSPERRRLARAVALLYVAPGALYFFARWRYYGLPLPLPFYVKVGGAGRWAGAPEVSSFLGYVGLPVLALALVGLGARARQLLPAAAAAGASLAFFLVPEHVMGFEWRFVYPVAPVLFVLAASSLAAPFGRAWPAAAALLLAFTCGRFAADRDARFSRWLDYARGLDAAHVRLGRELAACESCRATRVALADAGAISFYSGLEILDTFGLNDRRIATTRPYDAAAVIDRDPGLLIVLSSGERTFAPLVPHERALFDQALARGYRRWRTLRFSSVYWLWLLTPAGAPLFS